MTKQSKWRTQARSVIAGVKAENPDATGDELQRLVRDAYPFGPRTHHPYKIWLEEMRREFATPDRTKTPDHIKHYWIQSASTTKKD